MTDARNIEQAWETLGIAPTADAAEVRAAFRRRSMETHPDRNGSPEAFARVRSAYALLQDEALQRETEVGDLDRPHGPWIVDGEVDEVDVRIVEEEGRPRRRRFEDLFLDALRREQGND